jgi:hypothetical protein
MKTQKFAKLLNGRDISSIMTNEEEAKAKDQGLLIVYGESDDLMEFRGQIHDEIGSYEGAKAFVMINKFGKLFVITKDELSELEEKFDDLALDFKIKKVEIIAEWNEDENSLFPTWTIKTEIPNQTFEIYDSGNLFCKGIVISFESIEEELCKPI